MLLSLNLLTKIRVHFARGGRLGSLALAVAGCSSAHSCDGSISGSASYQTSSDTDSTPEAVTPSQDAAITKLPEQQEPDYGQMHAARASAELSTRAAPVATLQMLDGSKVDLSEVLGKKPVYLKFWATWCVPCLAQMEHLEASFEKYQGKVEFFAVNLGLNDSLEAVRKVQQAKGLTLPIAIDADGVLAEKFHVTVTPQHVLIDKDGVIRFVGHHANAELDEALARIASRKSQGGQVHKNVTSNGDSSNDLKLTLRDGSSFALSEHKQQNIALTFLSTWADWYLVETRPEMSKLAIEHAHHLELLKAKHPEIFWMSVANPVWTEPSDLGDYLQRLKATGPIGIDEGSLWFQRHGVRDVPTTIFFAKGGKELARATDVQGLDRGVALLLE